jgi:hypothetical protein
MELNEVAQNLARPIRKVWNYIGSDAYDFCESNEDAIEFCIDADRLTFIADDAKATDLLREAIAQHDYNTVIKALSQQVFLF